MGPCAGPLPARSGAVNTSPGKCGELLRPHFWLQLWRERGKGESRESGLHVSRHYAAADNPQDMPPRLPGACA